MLSLDIHVFVLIYGPGCRFGSFVAFWGWFTTCLSNGFIRRGYTVKSSRLWASQSEAGKALKRPKPDEKEAEKASCDVVILSGLWCVCVHWMLFDAICSMLFQDFECVCVCLWYNNL